MLGRLAALMREARGIPANKPIDVPLAIALSKIDVLRGLLPRQAPGVPLPAHDGRFDATVARTISEHLRADAMGWLGERLDGVPQAGVPAARVLRRCPPWARARSTGACATASRRSASRTRSCGCWTVGGVAESMSHPQAFHTSCRSGLGGISGFSSTPRARCSTTASLPPWPAQPRALRGPARRPVRADARARCARSRWR